MLNKTPFEEKTLERFDAERAAEFAVISSEIFAPVYPVIARQVLERCGVREGLCLDLGCGPANLAVALAKRSSLKLYAMDFSTEILRFARENIMMEHFANRVGLVAGDVHRLPFPDGVFSLIVSRGSVRFWGNKILAFREMRRVLRSGGKGYVGGGLGSRHLAEEIGRKMVARGLKWENKPTPKLESKDMVEWQAVMDGAGIRRYDLIRDDSGSWLCFENLMEG